MKRRILSLGSDTHPAHFEEVLDNGVVRCHLCPRNCVIEKSKYGACGVRANKNGNLVSLNYGKSVHITEEKIEVEAVYHRFPGERILSLGNVGCNLFCSYCQNWTTSQIRYLSEKDIYRYTPELIVETAIQHDIHILSWTCNDPVVWHEFVIDTAKLAKKAGLINLFKSAFFITQEAVEDLLPYIDIFSISIKSMDPEYYHKLTGGRLQPVLDATKLVFNAGKHIEISTLMVTDKSDDEMTAREVSKWVLAELSSDIPVHFTRFHPDYKLLHTARTPISRLIKARKVALEMGLKHVYLGNVFDTPYANTYCHNCNTELVTRYGFNTKIVNLDNQGRCLNCKCNANIKFTHQSQSIATVNVVPENLRVRSFDWHGNIRSVHIQVFNTTTASTNIYQRRRYHNDFQEPWQVLPLKPGESYRITLTKNNPNEIGITIALADEVKNNLHEVFDRAHYPTVAIEKAVAQNDTSPLPIFKKTSAK